MYIFQPDRALLRQQILKFSRYMTGVALDVGSGEGGRYEGSFPCQKYMTMDVHPGKGVDIVGRAEKIPLPDGSVDSVVCTQVFEHLSLPVESAAELHRILKPGGHILLTVPQSAELHEEPNDFFRYTNFGLERLFGDAGFAMVECEQRGGFFSSCAQETIRYAIDRLSLYERPLLGRVLGKLIAPYGKFLIWLDGKDRSAANRKHAIGWCCVFKKK